MANYTKSTNFAVKDTLTTGDPQKIVSGVEIDTEFVNISSMSSTKIDKVGGATANNIATLTAGGSVQDSGDSIQDVVDQFSYDVDDLKTDLNASGDAPLFAVRAWASFQADGTVNGSGNVDSVTKVSAGRWQVNFTEDMEDTNYAVTISQGAQDRESILRTRAVDSVEVGTFKQDDNVYSDASSVTVAVVR